MRKIVELVVKISVEFALFSLLTVLWLLAIFAAMNIQTKMSTIISWVILSLLIGGLCLISALVIIVMLVIADREIFG